MGRTKEEDEMRTRLLLILGAVGMALLIPQNGVAGEKETMKSNPKVAMETSMGTITVELWPDKAPKTVENFLRYVDEQFYEDTLFHRVIDGFMIQGGGMTREMERKPTHKPIVNEASTELKNERGTIAMARTQVVDSATSQFFINVADNEFLDHQGNTPDRFGYAVFGKVVDGMDVVDRIEEVETTAVGPHRDVPETPVLIKRVYRVDSD
jgi:peptidyl-prolyl cis-trans isomerase B (cyclophilin B)